MKRRQPPSKTAPAAWNHDDGTAISDRKDMTDLTAPVALPLPKLPPRPTSFFDIRGDLVLKAGRRIWASTLNAARAPAPMKGERRTFSRRWAPPVIRGRASVVTDDAGITVQDWRETVSFRWEDIDRFVVDCAVSESAEGMRVSKHFAVALRNGRLFVASRLIPWQLVPVLNRRLAVERGQDWQGPPVDVVRQMVVR